MWGRAEWGPLHGRGLRLVGAREGCWKQWALPGNRKDELHYIDLGGQRGPRVRANPQGQVTA